MNEKLKPKTMTNQNTTYNFEEIIDNAIRGSNEKRPINSWHISKLGSCLTGVYLERMGVEPDEDFDARTLRVFDVGKRDEAWFLSFIPDVEEQIRVEDKELDISGRIDAKVGDLLLEIKTKHSRAFWWMINRKQGADRHHQYQLWTYLYLLNLPKGELVYISRDDRAIQRFPVFLSDEGLKAEVMNEISILNNAWSKKIPPEPLTDPADWRVKYCRWHQKCIETIKK